MSAPQILTGLSEIAETYDALMCDAWGVIHNGLSLSPGVEEALIRFRETRGPVTILTNAPRLSDAIPPQLDRLGLSRNAWDSITTSGDATLAAIKAQGGKPAFKLGPDKDDTLFDSVGVEFVPLEQAEYILCTGLFDDSSETPEDYRDMLTRAQNRSMPMICVNPDIIVHLGDREIYCAGALAQLYTELGGNVIMSGKPYAPIYDLARQRLTDARDGKAPERILAIGDSITTDIRGANGQHIDVLFVTSGIFRSDVVDDSGTLSPSRVGELLARHNTHAVAATERLIW